MLKNMNIKFRGRKIGAIKTYIGSEVFIYVVISSIPGYVISSILALAGYDNIAISSIPVFLFFAIFYLIVKLNNDSFIRDKNVVRHLFITSKIDYTDQVAKFRNRIAIPLANSVMNKSVSVDLLNVMKQVFGEEGNELANHLLGSNGDILQWMANLDLIRREKLYRYILSELQ